MAAGAGHNWVKWASLDTKSSNQMDPKLGFYF